MKPFSHVGWLLGALFSSAVLGLLFESISGGSWTRKVVISLEISFKILFFERVANTPVFGSILDPFGARRPCFRAPPMQKILLRVILMDFRAIAKPLQTIVCTPTVAKHQTL